MINIQLVILFLSNIILGVLGVSSTWMHGTQDMTVLLDHLLDGYDRRLRPGFGGPPLVIMTDILIRSMGPMSEGEMVYSMDCYFRQYWMDERLTFNSTEVGVSNVSLSVKMLELLWYPDTFFLNGGNSYLHTITSPNKFFRLHSDGFIYYSQRLTIKAGCSMQLESFPMDTQRCPLHVSSFGYADSDVMYIWRYGNEKAVEVVSDMAMSQFDLIGLPASNQSKNFKGGVHSMLTVFFHMRRHTGYFLIQVYVPCCLLVVLSWVSFFINREACSDRIALGTTTVLTMTFLALENRDDLPRVTYYTALDIYVIMCFMFVFASIVQYAAVHYFTKYITDDREKPRESDESDEEESKSKSSCHQCAQGKDPGFYEVDDDFITDAAGDANNDSRKCFKCILKFANCLTTKHSRRFNKHVRNAMGLNSVSKIDKVARVLFPATFLALNIFYWVTYSR